MLWKISVFYWNTHTLKQLQTYDKCSFLLKLLKSTKTFVHYKSLKSARAITSIDSSKQTFPASVGVVRVIMPTASGGESWNVFLGLRLPSWDNCVTFAESEPYCHSILFVCLSGCLSVIPRLTAYHDWSITTKFGQTRVSLFGSPISHTFGARGKNMQNFAYFLHVDSGSRQTLLVLQFVIEFANIRAQYSPSTYASTHVSFFWFVP